MNALERLNIGSCFNYVLDISSNNLSFYLLSVCRVIFEKQHAKNSTTTLCQIVVFCNSDSRKKEIVEHFKQHSSSLVVDDSSRCVKHNFIVVTTDTKILASPASQHFGGAINHLVIDEWNSRTLEEVAEKIDVSQFASVVAFAHHSLSLYATAEGLRSFIHQSKQLLQATFHFLSFPRTFMQDHISTFQEKLKFVNRTPVPRVLNVSEELISDSKTIFLQFVRQTEICLEVLNDQFNQNNYLLNCSFDYSPKGILNSLRTAFDRIGCFGALVVAKKFKVDLLKLLNASEKPDCGEADLKLSVAYQLACSAELHCLELFELTREQSDRRYCEDFVLQVLEQVKENLKSQRQILILCRDRLLCTALAASLRLLTENSSNQNEGRRRTPLVGHLCCSYSTDKSVQLVSRQKQSEVWFEFGKGKYDVLVATYDIVHGLNKQCLKRVHIFAVQIPETVHDLSLFFRSPEKVLIFEDSGKSWKDAVLELARKVEVVEPLILCKYIIVSDPIGDQHSLYETVVGLCRKIEADLKTNENFQTLKRHQDKLPKDAYTRAVVSLHVDLDAKVLRLNFSVWRTDVKQSVDCEMPPVLHRHSIRGCVERLCQDAVDTLKQWGEICCETGDTVKRSHLIRTIVQDINQEEDEEFLALIEADSTSDALLKGLQGSKKRRRVYPKSFPSFFAHSAPSDSSQCFFYPIRMRVIAPAPVREGCEHLTLDSSQCLGILTSVRLPDDIPQFTIHTREGEEAVGIELGVSVMLSDDEIDCVEMLHQYLFGEVLRIEKDSLLFDPTQSPLQYYIAVATEDEEGLFIDFQLMSDILAESQVPFKQPHPFKFCAASFEKAVVSPVYRKTEKPHRMYVVRVREELTPLSQFPRSSLYETYSDYYRIKYGADVSNLRQPLLQVEYTNLRLNLLTSRVTKPKGKGDRDRSDQARDVSVNADDDKQYFVPELCYVWPISAPLWKKAICLPSILYRVEQLLLCHSVREQIMAEAGIHSCQSKPTDQYILNSEFEKKCFEAQRQHFDGFNVVSGCELPSTLHILQCLTMASCTDVVNLERVETIGDSFLKFVSSVAVATQHQTSSSGELSVRRCRLVSNQNLFRLGLDKNIPACVFHHLLDPLNNWLPPSYLYQPSSDSQGTDSTTAPTLNFSEDWKSVETGVWTNDLVSPDANDADPEITNRATYRMWSQNVSVNQGGVDWATLPVAVPNGSSNGLDFVSANTNGSNGRNGLNGVSHLNSPFSAFTLSEDLLSTVNDSEIDREIEDTFLHPDEEVLSDSIVDSNHSASKGATRSKKSCKAPSLCVDKNNLPSPYTENCLSDKSIADVVEALIGCYFVQSGFEAATRILNWLSLPTVPSGAKFTRFEVELSVLEEDLYKSRKLHEVEGILNYEFRNKKILVESLTHPSMCQNRPQLSNYQQLEFIGDAVLDFIITKEVFFHPDFLSSGSVTDLRAALVNNIIFASLAVQCNLHKYIMHQSSVLTNHIDSFIKFIAEQQSNDGSLELGEGIQLSLADDLRGDVTTEEIEVPKPLGDVFEAVAAAIYIDSNFSVNEVWRVLRRWVWPAIEQYSHSIPMSPMRELMELKPGGTVSVERIQDTIDHKVQVRLTVTALSSYIGVGLSLRAAKTAAALQALQDIKQTQTHKPNT